MNLNIIYLLFALLVLAGLSTASDYIVDDNMDMRTNQIYNATWINSTNLQGDLESEYLKSPPANPGTGYAMSYFSDNFSTVVASYFGLDGAKFMESFDAMGFSLSNGTYSNFTYFFQNGNEVMDSTDNTTMTTYVDAQDLAYNTTMNSYVDAQDDKQLSLSGGTMNGNVSIGNYMIKLGGSDEACIEYNGSALILSTVAGDCA